MGHHGRFDVVVKVIREKEPCPPDMQAALLRFLHNREKHTPITAADVEKWLGYWNAECRQPSERSCPDHRARIIGDICDNCGEKVD